MIIIIDESLDGVLIRTYLKSRLGFSQSMITSLKARPDGILINGAHATVRHELKPGERLEINFEDTRSSERIKKIDKPLDIIFENDSILAVNKPYGLAVHPSKKLQDDTLAGRVVNYLSPRIFRCITRLDRDTSGAVLIAKDKPTAARLTRLMEAHRIKKCYLAVVRGDGQLPADGIIRLNIRLKPPSFIERETVKSDEFGSERDECGCRAETRFEIIAANPPYYLLRIYPLTGRTHQLRVHFSGVGFPIVGDTLYGGQTDAGISRQALHAARLEFTDADGTEYCLSAPLHDDFRELIKSVFGTQADTSALI